MSDWEVDALLLASWRAGDKRAGAQLFARHGPALLRMLRNKVSVQDSEELCQETFLRLIKKRDEIEDGRAIRAYLMSTAKFVLYEHFRRVRRDQGFDPSVDKVAELVPGASTIIVQRQEQVLLLNALRQLPVEQQMLLELDLWEQLNSSQLARVMGLNASTLRTRLEVARKALRAAVRNFEANPQLVESTLAGLDDWADDIRVRYLQGLEGKIAAAKQKKPRKRKQGGGVKQ